MRLSEWLDAWISEHEDGQGVSGSDLVVFTAIRDVLATPTAEEYRRLFAGPGEGQ